MVLWTVYTHSNSIRIYRGAMELGAMGYNPEYVQFGVVCLHCRSAGSQHQEQDHQHSEILQTLGR